MYLFLSILFLSILLVMVLFYEKIRIPGRFSSGMYPAEIDSLTEFIRGGLAILSGFGYLYFGILTLSEMFSVTLVSNTFLVLAIGIFVLFLALNLDNRSKKVSIHKKVTTPAVVILILFLMDIMLQKIYPGEFYLLMLSGVLTITWDGLKWLHKQFQKKKITA